MAKDNVTINGLLPGRFDIDRLRQKLDFSAAIAGHSVGDETVCALSGIPVDRIGTPEEFEPSRHSCAGNMRVILRDKTLLLIGRLFWPALRISRRRPALHAVTVFAGRDTHNAAEHFAEVALIHKAGERAGFNYR